jgi:hypothetical protein
MKNNSNSTDAVNITYVFNSSSVADSMNRALRIFLFWGWGGSSTKRGCQLTLAYYAFRRWNEFGERRWNDILTGRNRRTRRKTCPSVTLSTTNPTWIDTGANPVLRVERPATKNLERPYESLMHLLWKYDCVLYRVPSCELYLRDYKWQPQWSELVSRNAASTWRSYIILFNLEMQQEYYFY